MYLCKEIWEHMCLLLLDKYLCIELLGCSGSVFKFINNSQSSSQSHYHFKLEIIIALVVTHHDQYLAFFFPVLAVCVFVCLIIDLMEFFP